MNLTPAQWLKQHILARQDEDITSLGEMLLPTLLGAMEACWIDAAMIGLASAGLLGLSTPLLPLWAPFVYIIGFHWMLIYLERRAASRREEGSDAGVESKNAGSGPVTVRLHDTPLFFLMLAALSLFIIWLQIYSATKPLYDLTWLLTLGSDALFLNLHLYQAFFIVAFSCFLCWRGLRLLNRPVEPSHVVRGLLLGLTIIIAAVLLRAAIAASGVVLSDTILLFLLIPVFLFLSLAAHALARIVFERRSHTSGLQGSVVAQERAVVTSIGSLGIVLLVVTILVGLFADPTFFNNALHLLIPVGNAIATAYNWLVDIFAYVVVFLATPIFWLITWLGSLLPHSKPNGQNPPKNLNTKPKPPVHTPASINPDWLPYVRAGVLVLLLLALISLVWWALRRRSRRAMRIGRKDEDIHESLWSWLLLWTQLKGILRALFGRFFKRSATERDKLPQAAPEALPADSAAYHIREIYRALLKKAAVRGYPRKKYETPLELRQRLDEGVPLVEPQLESLTEAYEMVRYGGSLPDADDVAMIHNQWRELDQKWV